MAGYLVDSYFEVEPKVFFVNEEGKNENLADLEVIQSFTDETAKEQAAFSNLV